MHVEAVNAGGEALQLRVEDDAVGRIHRDDAAGGLVALFTEEVHFNDDLLALGHRIVELDGVLLGGDGGTDGTGGDGNGKRERGKGLHGESPCGKLRTKT